MLFDRRPRKGPRALALLLAACLPMVGQAQPAPKPRGKKAAPTQAPPATAAPAPEPTKSTGFQTYLNAAIRLYENLEYEQALDKLQRAKAYVSTVEQDALLSLYEGIIQADMGRQAAEASFRAGLLLNPDAKLPLKVYPKVERDFEAIREDVRRELEALKAKQDAQQAPPAPVPPPVSPVAPSVTAQAPAPRSNVVPYSLLGGGAALAGAGVALSLSALSYNDRKRELTANEAILARDKASTQLTVGGVLFGTGMAALASGVTLLLLPQSSSTPGSSSPSASLQLTPLSGGFAVGTTGQF